MTHRITVKISLEKEPEAVFTCYEPGTAWCRQNAVGRGEGPPETRCTAGSRCWRSAWCRPTAAGDRVAAPPPPPLRPPRGQTPCRRA